MLFRMLLSAFKVRFFKAKNVAILFVLILLCSGSALAADRVVVTDVLCDNQIERVFSFSDDPGEIAEKTGFSLEEKDKLLTDYFDSSGKGSLLIIAKEHDVLIYDGGKLTNIVTVAGTIGDALEKAGVKLGDDDKISLDPSVGIGENTAVYIERAFPVTVKCDGKKIRVNTTENTVSAILEKAGIRLGTDDLVSPKAESTVKGKAVITVKRVEYKTVKKTVEVDYETVVEYDDSLYEEQVYVKTPGVKGEQTVYYQKQYIDGKLHKTVKEKTELTKAPVTKVVIRGAMPSLYGGGVANRVISQISPPYRIDLDENNRPVKYKKKLVGKATAYCGGGTTSVGYSAQPGIIAVDPKKIPYGTQMFVISADGNYIYGYCIAGDTGGFARKNSAIADLYMDSYAQCMQFGRRNVEIYILE